MGFHHSHADPGLPDWRKIKGLLWAAIGVSFLLVISSICLVLLRSRVPGFVPLTGVPFGLGITPTPSVPVAVELTATLTPSLPAAVELTSTPAPSETSALQETPAGAPAQSAAADLGPSALTANDWPQVQRDSAHTGRSLETLGFNFAIFWRHAFQPERVYPMVQPIVTNGLVFVGTESGNLYAYAVTTGAPAWKFSAGGAILNSVASDGANVYFGAMDGAVYAIKIANGALAWKQQDALANHKGFSTAPVLFNNLILIGGRNGVFYALKTDATGTLAWQKSIGSPILQTAAANAGHVYFGAMDSRVYALNLSDGSQAWASAPLDGRGFTAFWPVVSNGLVIDRPNPDQLSAGIRPGFPFSWFYQSSDWSWLSSNGSQIASGGLASISDAVNSQNAVMASYAGNPGAFSKSLFLLNESNGAEAFAVPHWSVQTMHGPTAPPCVDRDNRLIIPVLFIYSGWARLDLSSQRVVDVLYDNRSADNPNQRPDSSHTPAGFGNTDENMAATCAANLILSMHIQESNANYTGAFDLNGRTWYRIAFGYSNGQMSNNDQGGGSNPASISNGKIFHISFNELIVRTTQ